VRVEALKRFVVCDLASGAFRWPFLFSACALAWLFACPSAVRQRGWWRCSATRVSSPLQGCPPPPNPSARWCIPRVPMHPSRGRNVAGFSNMNFCCWPGVSLSIPHWRSGCRVAKILPLTRKSGCPMCALSTAPSMPSAIRRKSSWLSISSGAAIVAHAWCFLGSQNSSRSCNAIIRGLLSPPNPTPRRPVGGEVVYVRAPNPVCVEGFPGMPANTLLGSPKLG